MKFGRNLYCHRIPAWASSYLNYNGLKKFFKLASQDAVRRGEVVDFSELLAKVALEIDNVEAFYVEKYENTLREATNLYSMTLDFFGDSSWDGVDIDELQYFKAVFIQRGDALKQLRWYGKVNEYGFRRILQKVYQSQVGDNNAALLIEVTSKLSNAQFVAQTVCLEDLSCVQGLVTTLTGILSTGPPRAPTRSLLVDHFVLQTRITLGSKNAAYNAIRKDDASALDHFFETNVNRARIPTPLLQLLLLVLVQCSITFGSIACVDELLLLLKSLHTNDFDIRDYLHLIIIKIIIKIGQKKLLANLDIEKHPQNQVLHKFDEEDGASYALLSHVLGKPGPGKRAALFVRDQFRRLPLHYAAHYGLLETCQLLLQHMKGGKSDDILQASEAVLSPYYLGNTPLQLAVICGRSDIVQILLDFTMPTKSSDKSADLKNWGMTIGNLLVLALRANLPEVVELLVAAGANIHQEGTNGESALYVATVSGHEESMKLILNHQPNIDVAEAVYGRTPLIVACMEGRLACVELLLEAGASPKICDHFGWTALDYAAYNGHIKVAKRLKDHTTGNSNNVPGNLRRPTSHSYQKPRPVRKSLDESRILVNLGSFNLFKKVKAVNLIPSLMADESERSETGLLVDISLLGSNCPSHSVELPLLEDMTNKPWHFTIKDPRKAKLIFRVRRKIKLNNTSDSFVHIGSGIAILGSLKEALGAKRESLIRDYCIPIIGKDTVDDIGTITFSFVVITPFQLTNQFFPARDILWNDDGPIKIVGHRGLGQNTASNKYLQIGENTIQSFVTAMTVGAAWVELDVQLTKDHVPVVYHDFLVTETGIDAWMHNVTLEQLKYISDSQMRAAGRHLENLSPQRPRSHSLGKESNHRIMDLRNRMMHTFQFDQKQFKANTRGEQIHESFITLDDLLSETPDSIPLNIEIKYPMLFEAQDYLKSEPFAIELNIFVDTILTTIYNNPSSQNRPIMFSSFSPEICILMSFKQTMHPIFFLSDSGNWPAGDIRATSFQEAIHFAEKWNLDGIVTESEPFVMSPRLVGVAKNKGLATASYGALNNDPYSAKIQADAGLDIIIVDAVSSISETLHGTV